MLHYRLGSFAERGEARVAVVIGDEAYDLAVSTGRQADTAMLAVLSDWSGAQGRIRSAIEKLTAQKLHGRPLDEVRWLAPLPLPGTVFCAGANYTDHVGEMAKINNTSPDPDPHTLGLGSWHFIKNSHSVIGPGAAIESPQDSQKLDWEVELAAVIGRKVRGIPLDQALSCVAGYTIANDMSARDLSRRNGITPTSPFRFDWLAHKSFDTACPLGPWIVPAEQIPDPQVLDLSLLVNGDVKQKSNTREMIFTVAEQIADLSRRMTLWPGDVIPTGTPAGTAGATDQFLKPGDQVSARIDGIGQLDNIVRAAAA